MTILTASLESSRVAISGRCQVLVNYDKSFAGALLAARADGRADQDVTEIHFPPSREGVEEQTMALFSSKSRTQELWIKQKMGEKGYRPATREEIFAYAADNPKFRKALVALGARWVSERTPYALAIVSRGGTRLVSVQYALSIFPPGTFFLGVEIS